MLASTIQRELAVIILRDLQDPRLTGLPTVTRVKVTADLAIAEVFVTVMGTPGQQTAALNALKHSAGLMRSKLTRVLTLRQAPFLNFQFDEELKKEIAILDLLRKVSEENAELDRKRAAAAAGETPVDANETSVTSEQSAPAGQPAPAEPTLPGGPSTASEQPAEFKVP